MNGSKAVEPILAIDVHVSAGWSYVSLVTPTRFATVELDTETQPWMLRDLNLQTRDPIAILKEHSELGHSPKIANISDVVEMEWLDNSNRLTLRTHDSLGKRRKIRAELSSGDARERLLQAMERIAGSLQRTEEPAGMWHLGKRPIAFSLISLLIFVGLGVFGLSQNEASVDVSDMRGGIARGLASLYNVAGPKGMIGVGFIITAGMMVWWFDACQNRPNRHVARPVVG